MQVLNRKDRDAYLRELADEFDVDYDTVKMLADLLGPNEDYDGLVTELEDLSYLAERGGFAVMGFC